MSTGTARAIVSRRPYVLLSCAATIDGYIDDRSDQRLMLSNDADFDRVDAVRASCDAILVGASTIRADDPRLLVRSAARRAERVARGLPESPIKVTVTGRGDLDPAARFFTAGNTQKIVYCGSPVTAATAERLAGVATVVDAGEPVGLVRILDDLANRGVGRLMVEGGSSMHTQFLTADLADELQLVIAPFFVGDPTAPRLVSGGAFPHDQHRRADLAEVRRIGDVVLLRYALSGRFAQGSMDRSSDIEPSGHGTSRA